MQLSFLSFFSGQAALGLVLYLTKIPIAAFTFWMFRVTESKLMQFEWFKWLYTKMMQAIGWLKSLTIYQSTMKKLKNTKEKLKQGLKQIKLRYFSEESSFVRRLKRFYSMIKQILKRD